jgi:hypothetical protein
MEGIEFFFVPAVGEHKHWAAVHYCTLAREAEVAVVVHHCTAAPEAEVADCYFAAREV